MTLNFILYISYWTNTFSLQTHQIQQLGQCPSPSEHDDIGTPLVSVLDVSGTAF